MPDTGIDLLWGIGGTPEGVLSAAAIRCVGGTMLGRLWPRDDGEAQLARDAGYDLERVLTTEDLVASEDCFFAATGRDRRRSRARRALRRHRRDDALARHARALGHASGRSTRTTIAPSCARSWAIGTDDRSDRAGHGRRGRPARAHRGGARAGLARAHRRGRPAALAVRERGRRRARRRLVALHLSALAVGARPAPPGAQLRRADRRARPGARARRAVRAALLGRPALRGRAPAATAPTCA